MGDTLIGDLDWPVRWHDSIDVHCHQTKASTRAQAEKSPIFSRTTGHRRVSVADGCISVVPGLDWQACPMAVLDPKRLFDPSAARSAQELPQVRWRWRQPYPACLLDGTG